MRPGPGAARLPLEVVKACADGLPDHLVELADQPGPVAGMSATVPDAPWGGGSGGLGGAAVRLDAVVAEDAAQAIEFAVQLLVFGNDGLDVCIPVGS